MAEHGCGTLAVCAQQRLRCRVLRRPQRFANYDPRPDLPFEDMDDERRPMSMLVTVLYGAAWGLAIVGIVVANWGR